MICLFRYNCEPGKGSAASRAIAGAIATIPEVAFITPMELAKIGLQLDREKRFNNNGTALVRHVHGRTGFWGIFPGFLGVQGRQALWTGTYFATLPMFESVFIPLMASLPIDQSKQRSVGQAVGGFVAGVAGAAANTPVDVVRTNLQKAALQRLMAPDAELVRVRPTPAFFASAFTDFFSMSGKILAEKGFLALYFGFLPKAVHLGGGGALMAWLVPAFSRLMYGKE
ncbi:MAG: MC/SLC25 family protein [archaeon]|nr:MC/SLC25 family protein [archaeon]